MHIVDSFLITSIGTDKKLLVSATQIVVGTWKRMYSTYLRDTDCGLSKHYTRMV